MPSTSSSARRFWHSAEGTLNSGTCVDCLILSSGHDLASMLWWRVNLSCSLIVVSHLRNDAQTCKMNLAKKLVWSELCNQNNCPCKVSLHTGDPGGDRNLSQLSVRFLQLWGLMLATKQERNLIFASSFLRCSCSYTLLSRTVDYNCPLQQRTHPTLGPRACSIMALCQRRGTWRYWDGRLLMD